MIWAVLFVWTEWRNEWQRNFIGEVIEFTKTNRFWNEEDSTAA